MQKNKMVIGAVMGAVVIGGLCFYLGTKHGEAVAMTTTPQVQGQFGGVGGAGRMRGGMNGGFLTGDVVSKDATSITVQSRDGSTKIALYSGTTQVLKSTSGTIDDVAVGSTISVQGTPNNDGSVTAQSIQIRPKMQTPPVTPTPAQ